VATRYMSLRDYVEDVYARKLQIRVDVGKLAQSSADTYVRTMGQLADQLEQHGISNFRDPRTKRVVQQMFAEKYQSGAALKTIAKQRTTIQDFAKRCLSQTWEIEKPKGVRIKNQSHKRGLTRAQEARYEAIARTDLNTPAERSAYLLSKAGGLRAGEISQVKGRNIFERDGKWFVQVEYQKGDTQKPLEKQGREVPLRFLNEKEMDELHSWAKENPNRKIGKKTVEEVRKKTGQMHDRRHDWAKRRWRELKEEYVFTKTDDEIKQILAHEMGHDDIKTLREYGIF
jgi:integrase